MARKKRAECPVCGKVCAAGYARRHCTPWRIARRTGYRTDPLRHMEARAKVSARKRKAIATKGARAAAAARGRIAR